MSEIVSYGEMSDLKRDLTKPEAEQLTTWIKQDLEAAWGKLTFARTHNAQKALGYGTWEEYVKTEFSMSRQHSYRLLDQGKVIAAIAKVLSPVGDTPQITEHQARRIKPHLGEVVTEIEERISGGEEPVHVVGDTVKHYAGLGNQTVSPKEITCPNCNGTGYVITTEQETD